MPGSRRVGLSILAAVASFTLFACAPVPLGGSARTPNRAPVIPPKESAEQEAQRIRAQREKAGQSGLVVLSAGSLSAGGSFQLLVEPVAGKAKARWLKVSTACRTDCLQRSVTLGGKKVALKNNLLVKQIKPGRWRLRSARFGRREQRFDSPAIFEVRKGYATYLGAFIPTLVSKAGKGLRVLRYSAIQQDLSHALSAYPETRGRRMINTARKLRKPAPIR